MLRKLVEVRVSGFVFRQDSPVAPFQHLEIRYCSVVSHGRYDLSVVPIGFATVSNAGLGEIADSILRTMLIAFAGSLSFWLACIISNGTPLRSEQ